MELLFNDSLWLCILPPNAWKCYHYYFPSRPIHSYPSMTSLVYYYPKVLLSRKLLSSVDTIDNAWDMHTYLFQMLLFICHYIWRTTTKTKLHSNNNNNNENKNINQHMSHWKLSNLCTWSLLLFMLLLLLVCNCAVAKTTKWSIKHMLLWNCVVATIAKW